MSTVTPGTNPTEAADGTTPDDSDKSAESEAVRRTTGVDRPTRKIAISLSAFVIGVVIVGLVVVVCVVGGLYLSARHELSGRDAHAADEKHAEQVATDYSVGASTIDFHDTKAWLEKLKANTTPNLAAKFDATAPQLEQILLPLQWTSKAVPIASTVTSESHGIYKVNTFLTVDSTSAQAPQGGRTTVTYALTVDRNSDWKITDVGGLDGALPVK